MDLSATTSPRGPWENIWMEWTERHREAIKSARHACGYDNPVRFVTQIIVVIFGIASFWLFGGPNDAWSEILVKSGATIALILILPIVYLWNLLRIGPVIRRNSALLLIIVGSLLAVAGAVVFSVGVMQFRPADPQALQ